MTTIINTPPAQKESGGGVNMIVGLLIIVVFGYVFFVYGLPAIKNARFGMTTQINVPNKIDVNINQPTP